MTPLALRSMCEIATADDPSARILLNVKEPKNHNGYRIRLFGRWGPLCVVINGRGGRLTVQVRAALVLHALNKIESNEVER